MSKRGKNRPPKLPSPPRSERLKPIVVRPCAGCHKSTDVKALWLVATDRGNQEVCERCQRVWERRR